MVGDEIPDEFLDPEGDAEGQDPDLGFETTTSRLRRLWVPWMCRRGGGRFVDPPFFGAGVGGVPKPAVAAYAALEAALRATGYEARSRWAYNCREIRGTTNLSLHSAGIAIDIDPRENPFSTGDPFAGKLKKPNVNAALAIKNTAGQSVWSWGGWWRKPDRMHFQLDRGPDAVDVDWSTVLGQAVVLSATPSIEPTGFPSEEDENMLGNGAEGKAVTLIQERLRVWYPNALPRWGADGDYGEETQEWVRRFQADLGLDVTGSIDGVTAALLFGEAPG